MAQAAESEEKISGRATARHVSSIDVEIYAGFDSIPDPLAVFFDAASAKSFFTSIPWYRTMLRAAGPGIDYPRIFAATRGGRPIAALVARERLEAGKLKSHMLLGPSRGTNASIYAPVIDADEGAAGLSAIAREIARASPAFHVLRFDCLDSASAEFAALADAFRAAHLPTQEFFNFHNFYEDVSGITFDQYLARRPPALRRSVLRAVGKLARGGRARVEMVAGGSDLEAALIDYALVDLQSWKEPEYYPACTPALARAAAGAGALRLGILYIDNEPAAAQIWLVGGGTATIWRHHYAQRFAKLSPGTVLTFEMFRRMISGLDLREIDFGPGEEAFKHGWLGSYRERAGLIAFHPRTAKGLAAAARHFGGHVVALLAPTLRNALRSKKNR